MKILFITASSAAGGGPRHLLDWMTALEEHVGPEFEPFLAAPNHGLFAESLREHSRRTFVLPERRFSYRCLNALKRFIRDERIELVHSFGRAGGLYGRLVARSGVPVFHSPQGVISRGLTQIAYNGIERLLRTATTRYVFGSEGEAEEARRRFGADAGLIVPPIVAPPLRAGIEERDDTSLRLGRPLVIGTVGRFVAHKRILVLADAVLKLTDRSWRLKIFGEGEQQKELETLAQTASGRLEIRRLTDRWECLKEIDVFASWSRSESFGLAVAEAMAMGVPCALSDVSGHRDLAGIEADGQEQRAWLFDPDNAESFRQTIDQIMSDRDHRREVTARATRFIREQCGPERVARQLWTAYRAAR